MPVRMAFDPAGDEGGPARADRGTVLAVTVTDGRPALAVDRPALAKRWPALARGPRFGVFFL
jgi:hypothetical protein